MDGALRIGARMPRGRGEDSLARETSVPAMRPRPRPELRAGRLGRRARGGGAPLQPAILGIPDSRSVENPVC